MSNNKYLKLSLLLVCFIYDVRANDLEPLCVSEYEKTTVLIVGDSISKCYSNYICEYMPNGVSVYHNKTNALDSGSGRRRLDLWIDNRQWDLAYFNFGMHDIIHDRDGKPLCKSPECKLPRTSIDNYKQNLNAILFSLNKNVRSIVYAETTPFLPDVKDTQWHNEDVPIYNSAAAEVMKGKNIKVDDLYSVVVGKLSDIQVKNDVHFKPDGCRLLAKHVAETMKSTLNLNSD